MAGIINSVIDLSHHQETVDFEQIAASGIVGVIHKAMQGVTFKDSKYAERKQPALDAGLLWGAYHFGDASDPVAQADAFLDVVKPDEKTLIVLDFELNTTKATGPAGQSMTLDGARVFVNRINQKVNRFPGLYGGMFLKKKLGSQLDPVLANCWLWIAQYTETAAPTIPKNWSRWTMWQYTDGKAGSKPHTVSGVGACDRDRFNGDLAALKKLWGVAADESNGTDDGAADSASNGG